MILDKLFEKKDLIIYIDTRIEIIKKTKEKVCKSLPDRKKGLAHEKYNGKIQELLLLKQRLLGNEIKDYSKTYWRIINEK